MQQVAGALPHPTVLLEGIQLQDPVDDDVVGVDVPVAVLSGNRVRVAVGVDFELHQHGVGELTHLFTFPFVRV